MSVIDCPKCGKAVSEEFGKCPYCGKELQKSNDSNALKKTEMNVSNEKKFTQILNNKKIIYSIFCILIAITLLTGVSFVSTKSSMNDLQGRVASLESENTGYQAEKEALIDQYDLLNDELEDAKNNIKSLEKTNTDLTNELKTYKDQQATIDSLNEKIAVLEGETQSYKDYVQVLEAQLAQNSQQASAVNTSASTGNDASTPIGDTVWLSATGEKYHNKPNCGNMNPNTARKISRSDAEAKGYGACKNCFR